MSSNNAATAEQPTTTQAFNKPAAELSLGNIRVSVWRQEPKGEAKYPTYQTRLEHSYYDKKSESYKPVRYATTEENRAIISLRGWADQKMLELTHADRVAARAAAPAPANG